MTITAPTLSPQGWIIDPSGKIDSLLSWFYETMGSQSYLYKGSVSSLQLLLQKYGSDAGNFTIELQRSLELYLSRYYDLAVVTTTNTALTDSETDIEITIHCLVTENGITHSVGDLLKITNSKVTAVSRLING